MGAKLEPAPSPGVEAPLRFPTTAIGLLSPTDFIPLLEGSGLMIPVHDFGGGVAVAVGRRSSIAIACCGAVNGPR